MFLVGVLKVKDENSRIRSLRIHWSEGRIRRSESGSIPKCYIFEVLKKKNWANFQRKIELFIQKIVTKLSKTWVWDPGPRSGIRKNLFRIPDPGVKKAPDPGSGSATLARSVPVSALLTHILRAQNCLLKLTLTVTLWYHICLVQLCLWVTDLIAGDIHIVHLGQIVLEYAPLDPNPLLGLQSSLLLHHPGDNNNQLHCNMKNWEDFQ